MTQPPLVLFRADASTAIGVGHVARCATLGRELVRRGWRAALASRDLPSGLATGLSVVGMSVIALPAGLSVAEEPEFISEDDAVRAWRGVTVLVTDHYKIDAAWQRRAVWPAIRIAIDDLASAPQAVDLLLNQNLGASAAPYEALVRPSTRLLLGPRYALVRPEFGRARAAAVRRRGGGRRTLVIMGGADQADVTGRAARAAASLGLQTDVIVGSAYPFVDRLRAWADPLASVTLYVDTADVAELMSIADVCIGAPGSASWERCTLGLPAILVTLAQNQVDVATRLDESGAAVSLGWHEDVTEADMAAALRHLLADPSRMRRMAEAAAAVTDGLGTSRVADAIEGLVADRAVDSVAGGA